MKYLLIAAAAAVIISVAVHLIKRWKRAKFLRQWGLEADEKQDTPSAEEIIGKTGYQFLLDPWARR